MKSLLAECERGAATTVVLEGGVGCGKTDLMDGFAHYAAETGATVLTATDIGGLPASRTDNTAWADSPEVKGAPELDELIAKLAETAPVVVCFDRPEDREAPHWRRLLEATRRRLRKRPVMLVLTLLPFGGCKGDVHCDLLRQPNLHRIRLGLLDRDQAVGLCEELHGARLDDALREELHTLSGGSPLLVRALAEELDMRTRSGPGAPWPYPRGLYAQVAVDCVHLSGRSAEAVALGMAALREFSDLTTLTAVLPLDAPEIVRGMNLLRGGRAGRRLAAAAPGDGGRDPGTGRLRPAGRDPAARRRAPVRTRRGGPGDGPLSAGDRSGHRGVAVGHPPASRRRGPGHGRRPVRGRVCGTRP